MRTPKNASIANVVSSATMYAWEATTVPSETVPLNTWATPMARNAPSPTVCARSGTRVTYWLAIPSRVDAAAMSSRMRDHRENANCSHAAALIDSAAEMTSLV